MLYKLKMKGEKLHGNIVTNETSGNVSVSKEISQYNIIRKSIHILLEIIAIVCLKTEN